MCLIVFAWRPEHAVPLVLAANRDEFHERPTLPLAEWQDVPGLYAGRDLQAGGTWLGVTATGRFAALTNIRAPIQVQGSHSRGELPATYLRGEQTPEAFLHDLVTRLDQYSGFNLLLGDRQQLWFLNAQERQPRRLAAGLYGLSNATLDSPWPKVERLKDALAKRLGKADAQQLLDMLGDDRRATDDELPDTGIGLEWERLLSSPFIRSPGYGTRASSLLRLSADGLVELWERRFDADGHASGETLVQLPGE